MNTHMIRHSHTLTDPQWLDLLGGLRHAKQSLTYTGAFTYMHACMHARMLGQTHSSGAFSHASMYSGMSACTYYTAYALTEP